jgi:hypothetical protein
MAFLFLFFFFFPSRFPSPPLPSWNPNAPRYRNEPWRGEHAGRNDFAPWKLFALPADPAAVAFLQYIFFLREMSYQRLEIHSLYACIPVSRFRRVNSAAVESRFIRVEFHEYFCLPATFIHSQDI